MTSWYYSSNFPAGEEALLRSLKIYGVEMSVGLSKRESYCAGVEVAEGTA